jgi:tripeptide aminopeptidase
LRRYSGHWLYLSRRHLAGFQRQKRNPQIVENYRGGDIALGIGDEVLSPVMFPVLHQLLGQTLITTDGKTLLGADDKAGIAEIMTALATLKAKNIPHGDIRVATPDEEVGKGRSISMSPRLTPAGPTVDGGGVGELEFENFNAASVTIKIVGNNVHPGTAKGVMVNALSLAARIHAEVPADEAPEPPKAMKASIIWPASKARSIGPRCTTSSAILTASSLRRASAR